MVGRGFLFAGCVCISTGFVLGRPAAAATPVFIKFDTYSNGTRISEQYASQGVHFLNDYATGYLFRASPVIMATGAAWSSPNVLVNTAYDTEIHSSANVPMVIRFDQPIAGAGMRLGRLWGTATTATITLIDCEGTVQLTRKVAVTDNFTSGIQVWDPTQRSQILIIDYGGSTSPEAIDDLAFQAGTGTCSDTQKPIVVINSHLSNAVVASSPELIGGLAYDNSGFIAQFRINGTAVPLSPQSQPSGKPRYAFSYSMPLNPGSNAITALAVDPSGNKGSYTMILNYGAPDKVQLPEFHLTQRGIMQKKSCDVDGPLVAGKFTIVRIRISARTSSGANTYVSHVEMTLYRKNGGTDQKVDTFWGTTYSPFVSTFDSASSMAGIHFWIPAYVTKTPGQYRMKFQAYLGTNTIGPVLEPPCTNKYFQFDQMKTVRLFVLPAEAPLFSQALGQKAISDTLRVLDFFKRAYPIAEDGLTYVVGSALPISDGTVAMDMTHDYIQGSGFAWRFKDTHTSGIFRPHHKVVFSTVTLQGKPKYIPVGGQVTSTTLKNLPAPTPYGLFRPGGPPQWLKENKRYCIPMDDNHNGSIDDDMSHYIAEFYDKQTSQWSTNLQNYDHGETFRGFRDLDGDYDFDRGEGKGKDKFLDGEPIAPIVRRWRYMDKYLLLGPALQAMNDYNDSVLVGPKMKHAVLWFPEPFHPAVSGWGMLGDGRGKAGGSDLWIRASPYRDDKLIQGEHPGGEGILSHEMGHNFGLADTYGGKAESLWKIKAWQSYAYYKAVGSKGLHGIMFGGTLPVRLFFTDVNYAFLHGKLKGSGSASPPRRFQGEPAFRCTGMISGEQLDTLDTRITSATEFSEPDPFSPYHLRLGAAGQVLFEFGIPLQYSSITDDFAASSPVPQPIPNPDEDPGGTPRFDVVVPFPGGTEWVEVAHEGVPLVRLDRSLDAPTVNVLFPNGGQHFGPDEEVLIEWGADDPDGNELEYSIQYSPDAGTRWYPIASGVRTTFYSWNTAGSPGGQEAWIQVTACDGFNTGRDRSDDVFAVEGKPPAVAILSPEQDEVFQQWDLIPLRAMAIDPEEGSLSANWTLSSDGFVTTTVGLSSLMGPLEPGHYQTILEVRDAQDLVVVREVMIHVIADSDRDGMPDAFEEDSGLDPGNPNDSTWDGDEDELSNFDESWRQLNPWNPDTDGDGWWDGFEVGVGSDPLDPNITPYDVTRSRVWKRYR